MKTTNLLRAVSLLLIFVIAVSCRNSRSTTGRQYPRNPTTETSTKTTTVIVDNGNLPPGQAKKVYGDKSAKAYAPGQRKKSVTRYPLVIVYTPGIVIKRYTDGRYYYTNTAGYTYWKGYDGRYYLDEKHLNGMDYEVSEYDDWKLKGQKNNKVQEVKAKEREEEKVKEDQKTKDVEHGANVKDQKENEQNQKSKDKDQKEKDHTDQKAKDDKAQKGKAKSKR